jgi:hypothetical protein
MDQIQEEIQRRRDRGEI